MDMLYFIIGFIIGGFCLYFLYRRRLRVRLEAISSMLSNLKENNYSISMVQDDFSILEDGIYKLFLELVESRERNEDLYKEQAKNLEDIAHQIKTPITAISFKLDNMDMEKEAFLSLKRQVDRLNSLTDILLKLSSLDANINFMKRETFLLEEAVDYSLDILAGEIEEKRVSIVKSNLDCEVIGDFYWISEAFINILKNGINVSEDKKIVIRSKENPIYTEISFEDEGGGIAKANMRKIFKRFYKAPNSQGFGLGLAMSEAIVRANKGEIGVENTEKGAVFSVKFYK